MSDHAILTCPPRDVSTLFADFFGRTPQAVSRAPGRVEFIGNHTDYNGGRVIGAAINRFIWVAASPNSQRRRRLATSSGGQVLELPADHQARLEGSESWANYPMGVWHALGDLGLPRPEFFDLAIHSNLPAGAGLSSSAAVELATALALLRLVGTTDPAPALLARIGQWAENRHVGVPCGILDQGTCAFGREGHLVRIECRGPEYSLVPFPAEARLWVFNTRTKHALTDGLYATRRRECEEAAAALGLALLTDLPPERLEAHSHRLPPVQRRRARHVILEHARVDAVGSALAAGDLALVGRLLVESHRSSQHLFENSTAALDHLVDTLVPLPGVLGARLTGGGFGGAVMALTDRSFDQTAATSVQRLHAERFGREPEVLCLNAAHGAGML